MKTAQFQTFTSSGIQLKKTGCHGMFSEVAIMDANYHNSYRHAVTNTTSKLLDRKERRVPDLSKADLNKVKLAAGSWPTKWAWANRYPFWL